MIEPYYQSDDGAVTLYCGDCLDVMPQLEGGSVDAVVTDPPYGIAGLNKFGTRDHECQATPYIPIHGDDKPFDPSPWLQYPCVLWGANWYADRLSSSGGWLVWDKKDGGTSDNFADGEMAWTNTGRVMRIFRHKWRGMIKASEKQDRRVHITQKPIALMEWCLGFVPTAETILDPFMGSGTTGVACVKTGRRFIGIEISEEYCAIAKRRIVDAKAQGRLDLQEVTE